MTFHIKLTNHGDKYIEVVGGDVTASVRPGDSAQLLFPDDTAVAVSIRPEEEPEEAPAPAPEPPAPAPAPAPVEPPAPAPAPAPADPPAEQQPE